MFRRYPILAAWRARRYQIHCEREVANRSGWQDFVTGLPQPDCKLHVAPQRGVARPRNKDAGTKSTRIDPFLTALAIARSLDQTVRWEELFSDSLLRM